MAHMWPFDLSAQPDCAEVWLSERGRAEGLDRRAHRRIHRLRLPERPEEWSHFMHVRRDPIVRVVPILISGGLDGKLKCFFFFVFFFFPSSQPHQPSCPRLCEKDQPIGAELASGALWLHCMQEETCYGTLTNDSFLYGSVYFVLVATCVHWILPGYGWAVLQLRAGFSWMSEIAPRSNHTTTIIQSAAPWGWFCLNLCVCSWRIWLTSSKPPRTLAWSLTTTLKPTTCLRTATWRRSRRLCSPSLAWWVLWQSWWERPFPLTWTHRDTIHAFPSGQDPRLPLPGGHRGEVRRQAGEDVWWREDEGWPVCHWPSGELFLLFMGILSFKGLLTDHFPSLKPLLIHLPSQEGQMVSHDQHWCGLPIKAKHIWRDKYNI